MNTRGAFVREQLGSFFLPVSDEQHQCVERLLLDAGSHVMVDSQIGQEG
jgi:hypothetical protein